MPTRMPRAGPFTRPMSSVNGDAPPGLPGAGAGRPLGGLGQSSGASPNLIVVMFSPVIHAHQRRQTGQW
jgi:hypothetical protein